jgi:RNA polymerase primary sigma factor
VGQQHQSGYERIVPSVSNAQRLTPEQERDLAVATEAGDPEGARQLVEAFLPAICGMARRYSPGMGVERQEFVQEGVAGLLFAARRYDAALNTPFWAYASFWVRKAMQELVADLARPVALSDRAVRSLVRMRAVRREHVQTHGVNPTNAELSSATGFTPAQLESLQAIERTPRGIDERLSVDREEGMSTVGDTVIDPRAEEQYQEVLDQIEIQNVRELADQLDDRERVVIQAHFGLGRSAQTLGEIGGVLCLTAERARQIEARALNKMRCALARPVYTEVRGRNAMVS